MLILLTLLTIKNSKFQDGGGRHLEKSNNRLISETVWLIATTFGTVTVWTSWPFRPLKFSNFKNRRQQRPPFGKIEILPYLSNGLADRHEIWHRDARWPSWPFRPLKIWNFEIWKSNMAASRNVYGGCIKYLLRNLSVIEFGQFHSEILYSNTQPKYTRTHQEMRQRTWTFLQGQYTCRRQRLRPLNRLAIVNFYYKYLW